MSPPPTAAGSSTATTPSPDPSEAVSAISVLVHYPAFRVDTLELRGECTGAAVAVAPAMSWDDGVPLALVGPDLWRADLRLSAASGVGSVGAAGGVPFAVKVVANGATWQIGPNATFEAPPPGSPGGVVHVYPWFFTWSGRTFTISDVQSPQLNNARNLVVHLPPSYDENPHKVYENVLVMHDAQNLFDGQRSLSGAGWDAANALDRAACDGSAEEIVLLGIDSNDDRLAEMTPYYCQKEKVGGDLDRYLDFVEQTALPRFEKALGERVRVTRERLGMMGASLGGLASVYAGWTRSNVYGICASMSGSFEWGDESFYRKTMESTRPAHDIVFYLDNGSLGEVEDSKAENERVVARMQGMGWVEGRSLFYVYDEGAWHNEFAWQKRLPAALAMLYPATRSLQVLPQQ